MQCKPDVYETINPIIFHEMFMMKKEELKLTNNNTNLQDFADDKPTSIFHSLLLFIEFKENNSHIVDHLADLLEKMSEAREIKIRIQFDPSFY